MLRFQIVFLEQRRLKELCDRDPKPLAQFVNNAKFHGRICAIQDISDSGLGDTTFHIKLVRGQLIFLQQFCKSFADCFI